MISYLLAANCYGFLFFCFYLLLLRNRSSHTWNRIYLLGNVVLALVLPLVRFDIPGWYTPAVAQTLLAVSLPEVTLTAASTTDMPWYTGWALLFAGYGIVSIVLLLRLGYHMLSLRRFLHRQLRIPREDYHLALNTGLGPASYGRTIIFPGNEIDPDILAHEQAHVRYRHHYDKLVLQLLQCLFFPVIPLHLIGRELGLVHEFEADALAGHDKERYMRTLLSEHLGFHGPALLQPFFRHPLRRRIRMLQTGNRGSNRKAKSAVLIGSLLTLSAIIYAQSIQAIPVSAPTVPDFSPLTEIINVPEQETPAVKPEATPATTTANRSAIKSTMKEQSAQPTAGLSHPIERQDKTIALEVQARPAFTVSEVNNHPLPAGVADKIFTAVEDMPQPPFDVMKYLSDNIRYPAEAKQRNVQGRVVLQFVIDREGNVNNVVLQRDIGGGCGAEAVRVVKNMPKWQPGRQGGKPVQVYYTLPVSFKLEENAALPGINK